MRPEFLTRQHDILPPEKTESKILVIGAGAIGSQVTMCLAKMGYQNIKVYDFDVVSEENLNCQWYGENDIEDHKVSALQNWVEQMTGISIAADARRFDNNSSDDDYEIVISAVDSMTARKAIWNRVKDFYAVKYFIDARMSAEEGVIYTIKMSNPSQCDNYEKTLHTDEEGVQEACTAKSTMYCSMLLAGQISKNVKDISVEEPVAKTVMWNVRKNDVMFFN